MTRPPPPPGPLRKVDCVQLPVPDLDEGLDQAVARLVGAGATVLVEPADIPVGRVAVVADPFGNPLTVVDLGKGRYVTDAEANVTGVGPAAPPG